MLRSSGQARLFQSNLLHGDQFQGMGGTFGHTGRLQASIQTVHAIIAFYRLVGYWIVLRDAPGTGPGTGHATDALPCLHIDDAVAPLFHRPGGTDGDAERILAVVARAELELGFRDSPYGFERFMAYFAENRPHRQALVGLTMDHAAVTAYAPFAV